MADPFSTGRRHQEKFLRLSSSKVDDFPDYDTTSEPLHSPASSFSSHVSRRSPVPSLSRAGQQRQSSRSPLPSCGRSPRDTRAPQRPGTNETELKQKIQALEGTVAEYERQKFNVMGTFAEYRERVAERERKLEAEYSSKIITLSEEVLAAKKDFEERMKQFQALQEKFEREKEGALEKLREEHQKEINLLEQRCSEHQLLNLEQKYIFEIQRLDEERKSLKSEKEKLTEAFDSKLWRAQTLYDTELSAAKSLYSNELDALKDHEMALRDELLGRQEEFRDRLEELQLHLQQSKEELAKCEKEMTALEERLDEKEAEIQVISKQLEQARRETDEALAKLNNVQDELETTKQKYHEQEEQLLRKSDMLAALENAKNNLEAVVQDLHVELKSLKSKVTFLENERQNLESQSQTQGQLQNSQLQALEMVLDSLSKEKQTMKDHYEQQLEHERFAAEEREFGMKKEYTSKLSDLERQHKIFQDQLENKFSEQRENFKKKVETEFERKRKQLEEDNERLQDELDQVRKRLHSSAPVEAEDFKVEIEILEGKYREACERVANERKDADHMRKELTEAGETIKKQSILLESYNKSASTQHFCNFDKHHQTEIEILTKSIEKRVREEIMHDKNDGKERLHRKIEDYEQQIQKLRNDLAEMRAKNQSKTGDKEESKNVKQLQDNIDNLKKKLRQYEEMETRRDKPAVSESAQEKENMLLQEELQSTKAELTKCIDEHAERVNELLKHVDEQKLELDQMITTEQHLRDEIKVELEKKYAHEAASTSAKAAQEAEKHQKRCKDLQKELNEKDYESKLQRLAKNDTQKEQVSDQLNVHSKELKSELEETKKELEKKTQEIMHIRNETHEYIRKREQQQSKTHKRELENLKAQHKASIQNYEEAQAKITADMETLRNKLETFEGDTAKEPESNENLKELEDIKNKLQEKEASIKKLEEEKQALKTALDAAKDNQSHFSSPMGSMDSLKKRDSISSIGSAKEPHICRKAVNMAIINKWHCLVEQVKTEHKHTGSGSTLKSSSSSALHKSKHLTHGAIALAAAGSSTNVSNKSSEKTHEGSMNNLDDTVSESSRIDDEKDERPGRPSQRSHDTGSLRPPDSRRSTAKSPSRSPLPKVKAVPSGRRPAWRL